MHEISFKCFSEFGCPLSEFPTLKGGDHAYIKKVIFRGSQRFSFLRLSPGRKLVKNQSIFNYIKVLINGCPGNLSIVGDICKVYYGSITKSNYL